MIFNGTRQIWDHQHRNYDDRKILTSDPVQAQIANNYKDLFMAVVIAAIRDVIQFKRLGESYDFKEIRHCDEFENNRGKVERAQKNYRYYESALSFLKRQENLDLAGLDISVEDLFEILSKISPEEINNRLIITGDL